MPTTIPYRVRRFGSHRIWHAFAFEDRKPICGFETRLFQNLYRSLAPQAVTCRKCQALLASGNYQEQAQ